MLVYRRLKLPCIYITVIIRKLIFCNMFEKFFWYFKNIKMKDFTEITYSATYWNYKLTALPETGIYSIFTKPLSRYLYWWTRCPRGYFPPQLSDMSYMKLIKQCFKDICCICSNSKIKSIALSMSLPPDLVSYFNLLGFNYNWLIDCWLLNTQW